MKRISSGRTFFLKRIFPFLFIGIAATPVLIALSAGKDVPPPVYLPPLVLVPVLYIVMRKLVWDLADEVYDGGDYLLVKRGDEEERVPLSNVMNVSSSTMVNPPRITLRLAKPGKFGEEVVFSPVVSFSLIRSGRNPIAEDLIVRMDKARRSILPAQVGDKTRR